MAEEPTEEELFFIAADLTLYSNPLNRALGTASLQRTHLPTQPAAPKKEEKNDNKTENKAGEEKKIEEEEEEEDIIASDMNKYDSPLADLDMKYNQKHEVHQVAQETHLQRGDEEGQGTSQST